MTAEEMKKWVCENIDESDPKELALPYKLLDREEAIVEKVIANICNKIYAQLKLKEAQQSPSDEEIEKKFPTNEESDIINLYNVYSQIGAKWMRERTRA